MKIKVIPRKGGYDIQGHDNDRRNNKALHIKRVRGALPLDDLTIFRLNIAEVMSKSAQEYARIVNPQPYIDIWEDE